MIEQLDPKVLKLLSLPAPDQVAMVVRDLHKTIDTFTKLIQWGPFRIIHREYNESNSTYRGKPGNFKFIVTNYQLGTMNIELEMMQPVEGESIYLDFLKTGREGLHHFGFTLNHTAERIAAMKEIGIEVLQSGKRPGRKWAYMDTEPFLGVIIELRENIID